MDYALFCLFSAALLAGAHVWLRRSGRGAASLVWAWLALAVVLVAGGALVDMAGSRARDRIRGMLEGFLPTYAQEVERLGHASVSTDLSPEDPRYLAIVAAQVRWQAVNPSIADLYTMRKRPDGVNVLVVDSETDYDRNGRYEGDREQRTALGEVYDKPIPALEKAFAGEAAFMNEPYSDRWGRWVSAFVPLRDGRGRVEGVLGVDFPADRWIIETRRARFAAMGILFVFVIGVTGGATVVSLLRADLRARAAAEASVKRLNEDLEKRVVERTRELEAAHARLVTASHRAGMAEVASGVLHNVGNGLSSVNVAVGLLTEGIGRLNVARLRKGLSLLPTERAQLAAFLTSDPRGQKLPEFLEGIATDLDTQQRTLSDHVQSLKDSVEHVSAVVSLQQAFAKVSGSADKVPVVGLVESALRLNAPILARSGVEIVRDFAWDGSVTLEKHKAMQILVNLIKNAKQACDDAPGKKIVLRIAREGDRVRISVTDTGVGIGPELIDRIFVHGFTTRKDGHGFGLHSARLAASELGGSLTVRSDGPGKGATFTLELPVDETSQVGAAAGVA